MRARKRARREAKASQGWGTQVPEAPFYDFRELLVYDKSLREGDWVRVDEHGRATTDFRSREVTLALTRATLRHFFNLRFALPAGHLVPVIPGRVQYLRWAASLLACRGDEPQHVLDVGTGPSAIYALLGARLWPSWTFTATDSDAAAVALGSGLVASNRLTNVSIRLTSADAPLIDAALRPDLVVCNPPFFDEQPSRSVDLTDDDDVAGTRAQMSTAGGEVAFVQRLGRASVHAGSGVFTSLVGVKTDVRHIVQFLRGREVGATQVVHVQLDAGRRANRTTRWAVAWRFGPRATRAYVQDSVTTSEWSVRVRVIPGAKHANRLTKSRIMDGWLKAMCTLGWKGVDEHEEAEGTSGTARGDDDDDDGGGGDGGEKEVQNAKVENRTMSEEGMKQKKAERSQEGMKPKNGAAAAAAAAAVQWTTDKEKETGSRKHGTEDDNNEVKEVEEASRDAQGKVEKGVMGERGSEVDREAGANEGLSRKLESGTETRRMRKQLEGRGIESTMNVRIESGSDEGTYIMRMRATRNGGSPVFYVHRVAIQTSGVFAQIIDQ